MIITIEGMGGSFSIKSALPALFPDDPALDYHNPEGIHNGGEAMAIFPKVKDMPPEEQAITRRNLLKYCELDTFAMVKVWKKLMEVVPFRTTGFFSMSLFWHIPFDIMTITEGWGAFPEKRFLIH